MRRVPPSELIREEIDELFANGSKQENNLVNRLMMLGLQHLGQLALEQEQQDHLGRGRYERSEEFRGHRNGYEPATIKTAEGAVTLQVPQVRDGAEPFQPRLLEFLAGNSEILERLVVEMYARGLSTRDVEDCFTDATGNLLISKSAVSEISDALWEQFLEFQQRDLSDIDVEYMFLDAIYESLRRYGAKEGILAAWCITTEGAKVLLHLAVGNKESEDCWVEFLRNMIGRGLRIPTSVTADGAPGLINAIEAIFSKSLRVRCWFHKMQNIAAKLPFDEERDFVLAHVRSVRDAPTYEAGQHVAASTIARYGDAYPAAMKSFAEDLEASLNHLKLPTRNRIHMRTTNLLERSFEEERRRTKVIPRLLDEKSAMKLVFATLIRCSERWSRVPINELERQQLRLLRRELGIDPPPQTTTSKRKETKVA